MELAHVPQWLLGLLAPVEENELPGASWTCSEPLVSCQYRENDDSPMEFFMVSFFQTKPCSRSVGVFSWHSSVHSSVTHESNIQACVSLHIRKIFREFQGIDQSWLLSTRGCWSGSLSVMMMTLWMKPPGISMDYEWLCSMFSLLVLWILLDYVKPYFPPVD